MKDLDEPQLSVSADLSLHVNTFHCSWISKCYQRHVWGWQSLQPQKDFYIFYYHCLVVQEDTDTVGDGEEENLFLKITEAIFVGW